MVGPQRSTRRSTRRARPKYQDPGSDDDHDSRMADADDAGGSEFSGGEEGSSDGEASVPEDPEEGESSPSPVKTRARTGSRRSARPKYRDPDSDENGDDDDDDGSSQKVEGDGESDFSGDANNSDEDADATPNKSTPAGTRKSRRRGRAGDPPKWLAQDPSPSPKMSLRERAKRRSKYDKAPKETMHLSDDEGDDHADEAGAEESGMDQQEDKPREKKRGCAGSDDESKECKKPRKSPTGDEDDDVGEGPQSDAEGSEAQPPDIDSTAGGGGAQGSPAADKGGEGDADPPPSKADVDEVDTEEGVCSDEKDDARLKGAQPSAAEDGSGAADDGPDNQSPTGETASIRQQNLEDSPSKSEGITEGEGAKAKDLAETDKAKCKDEAVDGPLNSAGDTPGVTDIASDDTANAPVGEKGEVEDNTSPTSPPKGDIGGIDGDPSAGDAGEIKEEFERAEDATHLSRFPSLPPTDSSCALSTLGDEGMSFPETKGDVDDKLSDASVEKMDESNREADGVAGSNKVANATSEGGDDGNAMAEEPVTPRDATGNDTGDNVDATIPSTVGTGEPMSRIVSEETTARPSPECNASMDIESTPSPEKPAEDSPGISMSIQYDPNASTRQIFSAGQLKMALYLEASKAHRGHGPEHMFAKYWETFEKFIAVGSGRRMRSDAGASLAGLEATLARFLTTKKLKRLHNKLVLAIMRESMQTDIPARCSKYVPPQWKAKAILPSPAQKKAPTDVVDGGEQQPDLHEWNADFGRRSGAWTIAGEHLNVTKPDFSESIRPELAGCNGRGDVEDEDNLPSARLPGALLAEPAVRKRATNAGLSASDDAIWMLVVAAREHAASVIKKVIANDKDIADGYAPSLPNHFKPNLACQRNAAKADGGQNGADARLSGKKMGTKLIDATSLSHVLAEHHTVSSRLMSMYTAAKVGEGKVSSHRPRLDDVNCIINASIQRAASKRLRASPDYGKDPSATTSVSPTPASGHPSQRLPISYKPLPKSAAQRRGQRIPPLVAPQPQLVPASLASQNMQPLNPAQMMSHSDHQKEDKPMQQQAVSLPNIEPLRKPGFPGMANDSQKSQPAESSSPPAKTFSPPPKSHRRGSKNLAAMLARPSSQPKSATGDEKGANGASPDKNSTKEKAENEGKEGSAKEEKNDGTTESRPPSAPPARRGRGRGFGAKNLAAMRARASFTESGK